MSTPALSPWFAQLERLVERKGALHAACYASGGGIGKHWAANFNGSWPWCHGSTLEATLRDLVMTHARLDQDELRRELAAIETSAQL